MEYKTNKNGNLEASFNSSISIDNGTTNDFQGEMDSTMELFKDDNGVPTMIEWDVPHIEKTEQIGLFFDGKSLEDYDGVFELPSQAIKLIRKSGYSVPKHFEEE